jgi:hypothetical protein
MTSLMTWLVPATGPVCDHLVATMNRLAGQHDAPTLRPHVTLIPNLDEPEPDATEEALKSLMSAQPSIDLTFTSVGHETTYFRALYLVPEPSEQLVFVHRTIRGARSLEGERFEPHLSLLYAELGDDLKRPAIEAAASGLPLTIRFDAIELWAASASVRDWHRIARVPFAE